MPPLCRETQSLGQQMLKEPFGINGLMQQDEINLDKLLIYLEINQKKNVNKI